MKLTRKQALGPLKKMWMDNSGDRICQAVFMIHGITSNDKASGDRTGGIGSTNG